MDDVPGGGLSFWSSLDAVLPNGTPAIRPGPVTRVDVGRCRSDPVAAALQVIFDNIPAGHVTVHPASPNVLEAWAQSRQVGIPIDQAHQFTQALYRASDRITKTMPQVSSP